MKRLLIAGMLVLVALWWLPGYFRTPPAERPLTPEAIATLEPEICNGSTITQALTAVVPMNLGSPTTKQNLEQLALIDQYKGTGRRKVWVLRMPSAYINKRACDNGRKNWVGTGGDDMKVSQRFGIGLVLLDDRTIPVTLATKDEMSRGLPVQVYLINSVVDPEKWHRGNARRARINSFIDETHPPRCREEETDFGLVRFRRPDPDPERSGIHCGGIARGDKWDTKVYGKKIGTLTSRTASSTARLKANTTAGRSISPSRTTTSAAGSSCWSGSKNCSTTRQSISSLRAPEPLHHPFGNSDFAGSGLYNGVTALPSRPRSSITSCR